MTSSPKAPDPQQTAAAQTGSNIATATAGSWLNNTNQYTPTGSLTYTQAGTKDVYDPSTHKTYKVPQFAATQTLTPDQQKLLDQGEDLGMLFNDTAMRQGKYAADVMSKPFDYTTGEHEQWAGQLYHALTDDTNERNRASAQQRLAGQGLSAGSDAYNDAYRNTLYSQDKAYSDFMLGSQQQGFQQAQTIRNQPLNEIAAMMGLGGVSQPSWVNTPQASVPGTDIAGLYANQYNQQMAQQNAMYGAIGGGMGGALSAMGGWASGGFKNPFA